ncbi:Lipoate-protein ligase A [Corynebacterium glutamicum ATCC 13032]|uniref:Lipoate-protein ligase A n=1 Tax=Corynebacterium glutamicum (strain ATCC 13032 / DSM 20300 / JCM 1318 / BCRC 11384 / CCUG 27702 / LMG 3730 / NBRC 12168 / NCIMB 10025 / NRRL B-2784 / 534) TaxID=196627 RepID=Q8NRH5_CORGL|nr:Lipoate-protein ligase A [Corynebacterium glutamicum ATCC 13032]
MRRAVTGAQDFTDYEWEILHPGVLPTPLNVALDELLLDQVASGQRGPTMRIWDWDDRATVIGSFQSYVNEINQEGVNEHGVTVVRRMSGGGAMFMEGGNCITYSLYAPESLVAGLSYEQSYEYLDRWVIAALKTHDVDAWYVPINDITSTGGKIGGAAQKRRSGAVLHHVTMSYDIDADMMTQVLRIGKVKISDKGLRSAKKRVDPLRRQTGASREQIIDTLKSTFSARYGAQEVELSDEDFAAGHDLVKTKYATEEWTKRVQ